MPVERRNAVGAAVCGKVVVAAAAAAVEVDVGEPWISAK